MIRPFHAPDILILAGAPAVGKTTVAEAVREQLGGALTDMGSIREMYLDREWKQANTDEADMSFRLACKVAREFVSNGIRPVQITDVLPRHLPMAGTELAGTEHGIVSLYVTEKDVLQGRMLDPTRDSGFSDLEESWRRNESERRRELYERETRIDTTSMTVTEAAERVMQCCGWGPE